MWSYQLSRILGHTTVYGGSQFAECIETAEKITVGDYNSWFNEWNRLGDRVLTSANEAFEKGNKESARVHYLRAADYIRLGEFFLQAENPKKNETYHKGINAFKKGVMLLDNPPESVEIPYEDSFLPAYFYRIPGKKKSPVMVMFGGLDSTAEEVYYALAPYLLERGIGLIAVDGPGQGGALRINKITSRYDYEVAGSAIYDWAAEHPEIDSERIGIMAWSMGGYMAARIAAFEPRYKICGIFSAVYDYREMWKDRPDDHPLANIFKHVMGVETMEEGREKLEKYNLRNNIAEKIQCPTFILHGEDDRQGNIDQAYRLYNSLECPKWLHIVPKGQTGDVHCQADNHTKAFPLFDWIQDHL